MKSGYLCIESNDAHPGLVRLFLNAEQPDPAPASKSERHIRYIARFNDLDAALMHTHEILRRRLVDPDTHLYRVPLERAIAAAASVDLRHRQVYLDADLSDESRQSIDRLVEQLRAARQRQARFFQTLGYIGLGILLFNMLFLSFG